MPAYATSCLFLLTVCHMAHASPAADAYGKARDAYQLLQRDAWRRQLRHHWKHASGKFERVAHKFSGSPWAPRAYFMAGQLNGALAGISGRMEDVDAAEKNYRRLIRRWPKHRLSDDAALALAKLLHKRKRDFAAARTLLRAALVHAGDMRGPIKRLLAALPRARKASKASQRLKQAIRRGTTPSRGWQRKRTGGTLQHRAPVQKRAAPALPLAQQLGLKVKRVVVDPGHGGSDTGAIGKKGTREKDVALRIAKKLARKLKAMGLQVVMTRKDDRSVSLEERTRRANRAGGDLFISIHCNAARSTRLRGIETYSLNTTSSRYAARLAARENATLERGVGDLQYILADLATKANTGESQRLAERVQHTLVRKLSASYGHIKDLGHKEALFFVLLGARMPAVLVETAFLSNAEEEARLKNKVYQESVADSIAEAIGGFLNERNRFAQRID